MPDQGKLGPGRERLSGLRAMEEIKLLLETLTKTEKERVILLLLLSFQYTVLHQCLQLVYHAWKPVGKGVWNMWFLDLQRKAEKGRKWI